MEGILTACDQEQEWLLSWWYQNLRKYNPDLPVAFGDFGMSEKAKEWCKERGILIPGSQIPNVPDIPSTESKWFYMNKQWYMLNIPGFYTWFRKPFVMEQSPFKRTLWLDLDCQILAPLAPLFTLRLPETKLAVRGGGRINMISSDKKNILHIKSSNTGVVLFEKGSSLLDFWIDLTNMGYHHFIADDNVLAFAIDKYHYPHAKIPYKYNWHYSWGNNPQTAVLHWIGSNAKAFLKIKIHISGI